VRAEAASAGIEEANALASKKAELAQHAARIVMLTRRNSLLRNEGIQLTPVQNAEKTRQLVIQIGDRFRESPKSATLVDRQRWTKLTAALTEFIVSGETQQKADWKAYFSSKLFGGVPPEQRKQTILQSLPANKNALEQYTFLYQRFNEYRNTVPSTVEAMRELHTYSQNLADIEFVENDNVPKAVREFFGATATTTGASLDLLTPEVIEWLRTNKMLANYVVRAR
jgi:hypothetical protein